MSANSRSGSLTPVDAALAALLAAMPSIKDTEFAELRAARGRILAEAATASCNVPPQDNSAMDGYAVRSADVKNTPTQLRVSQRIIAGATGAQLASGEAARIFTGAPVPAGADAVVMQENTQLEGEVVTVLQSAAAGENLRRQGEDIAANTKLFPVGHRLLAQDLAVLAATGVEQVRVTRRLRVALLTTGNELVQPGTNLKPGQIYNSNFYALSGLLDALNVEVIDLGIVADSLEGTRTALEDAAAQADCVITTGGVSVGEEDHVKPAVEALGELQLWKLAIKPGKPFAFGTIGKSQFFGLPGNPVSSFVTFVLLVRPCLLQMQGCQNIKPLVVDLPAGFERIELSERQEYLRVVLDTTNEGQSLVPYVNQSSGVTASLSGADGLAIVPAHTKIAKGDKLGFIAFSELLY